MTVTITTTAKNLQSMDYVNCIQNRPEKSVPTLVACVGQVGLITIISSLVVGNYSVTSFQFVLIRLYSRRGILGHEKQTVQEYRCWEL